jgi:hypothetical protein
MKGYRRYHVNTETGESGECSAQKKGCPYGGLNGQENHYATLAEAQAAGEAIMAQKHGGVLPSRKKAPKFKARPVDAATSRIGDVVMPNREAALSEQILNMSANIVEYRAKQVGDLLVEPDHGDPNRAKEVISNVIAKAAERGNTHLAEKASKARMVPTSVIMTRDGDKFYTEEVLAQDVAVKTVEDGRTKLEYALKREALGLQLKPGESFKNTVKTDAGTFVVTVSDDGLNEYALANLSPAQRELISTPREMIDIDLARKYLSDEQLRQVISNTQVLDYVAGNPRNIKQQTFEPRTRFMGKSAEERLQDGTQALADFYGSAREAFGGSYKSVKERRDDMANKVKAAAVVSGQHVNTVIPGRSRKNALLISGRETIDRKKAAKVLPPDVLKKITRKTFVPSKKLAREMLSENRFGKIFNARRVSIRVVETP